MKEQLEANEIWIAMKSKIHIDELEQILFDVGAEAATTVNLDLSSKLMIFLKRVWIQKCLRYLQCHGR